MWVNYGKIIEIKKNIGINYILYFLSIKIKTIS